MKKRYVIKVTGAAGQGIKTSGLILAKSLKRAGYYCFGYTEYPSLIRGGHNVFQIEVADHKINSITKDLHVLLALNQESVQLHQDELVEGGILLYDEGAFHLSEEQTKAFQQRNVSILPLPLLTLAKESGGSAIMKNTVSLGAIWGVFKLDLEILQTIISQLFNKSEEIINTNKKCAELGYKAAESQNLNLVANLKTDDSQRENLIISGNESVGLGAISAGVRLYSSYPMTPASSILSFLAEYGPKYGMIVKQAEDEITAANMVIGAYHMGTRAMCATSGGGFDLMSEAVSLAGITETPMVVLIGQRPGPATGVPTWTAQGDLFLSIFAGHGEFPRIVLAISDPEDSFQLTKEAHNLAEIYQTPVLILSDKYLAESFFSTHTFDQQKVTIQRGNLINNEAAHEFADKLRYELTESGVSPRWLPGSKGSPYLTNSDEHTERGYSTEEADEIKAMMDKRMRKIELIKNNIPDPEIYGEQDNPDICIISWGSNKNVILDAISEFEDKKISYIHYKYLWPFKPGRTLELIDKAKYTFSVDNNYQAQFARLFEFETGVKILDKLTKYDSRPFYLEELVEHLTKISK